nr:hypothetical protein [Frankia casuarinae]
MEIVGEPATSQAALNGTRPPVGGRQADPAAQQMAGLPRIGRIGVSRAGMQDTVVVHHLKITGLKIHIACQLVSAVIEEIERSAGARGQKHTSDRLCFQKCVPHKADTETPSVHTEDWRNERRRAVGDVSTGHVEVKRLIKLGDEFRRVREHHIVYGCGGGHAAHPTPVCGAPAQQQRRVGAVGVEPQSFGGLVPPYPAVTEILAACADVTDKLSVATLSRDPSQPGGDAADQYKAFVVIEIVHR